MKVSLIGYMGSGKTTIGKELAEKLKTDFLDLDKLIENHTKKTISELFKELGEIRFRKIEREVLMDILNTKSDFILAVGGGTPVYYDNMNLINEETISIYLRANPKFLSERLINEKLSRPMIAHLADEDLLEFIAKHLFERRNFYEESNFKIDIQFKSVSEISEEIIHLVDLPQR
ncbi:shikimate kinase [Moheibacter sediminis]|uniref:Shikimate kinase n=1 Tax=Moheibacter sediminis TaxID=1434700 RepID=A0A1W1ZAF8_9FLAO|nr:shikimate kinase [Moheibacter sediminis]SMC45430.1 shikimate kinase [Moheibacter sediminis]